MLKQERKNQSNKEDGHEQSDRYHKAYEWKDTPIHR